MLRGHEAPLLFLLAACAPPEPVDDEGATLLETQVPTVFKLVWDTEESTESRVEYGISGAYDHVSVATDSDDGHHHVATLLLGAGETWSWRAVNGDEVGKSGEQEVQDAPATLPELHLTVGEGSPDGGYIVGATPNAGEKTAIWVIDSYGRYVWWQVMNTSALLATDARLSADGEWIEWVQGLPGQAFHRRRIDGRLEETYPIDLVHHDFVQLPEGGWAAITQIPGEIDGEPVLGEGITEIAEDGTLTPIFDAWDWVDIRAGDGGATPGGIDAMHANGLYYDELHDRYYLSSWARNSILAIERSDGSLRWELGETSPDLVRAGGEPFAGQHGPRIDNDGDLIMLDNGPAARLSSRVVAWSIDETNHLYRQHWRYEPEPSIYAAVLGNPERMEDGRMFISWGSAGRLEILNLHRDVSWQLDASLGGVFGYAHPVAAIAGSSG